MKKTLLSSCALVIFFGALINQAECYVEEIPNPPIIKAVDNRDLAGVENALTNGADINNDRDAIGTTALMLAVGKGCSKITERLLRHPNIDLNARDYEGHTALIAAAATNHPHLLELLLQNKADINVADNEGNTALIWAVLFRHRNTKTIELLLRHNGDVNARNNDGKTALDIARETNKTTAIQTLENYIGPEKSKSASN